MWLYLGNEWNWRWCRQWGIQCNFQRTPRFKLWNNCWGIHWFWYRNMQFSACSQLRYSRLECKFSTKICGWISPQRIWKGWYRSGLSDNDDVGIGNAKVEAEVHKITTCKVLTLLDKPVNLKELNKDERASFSSIKDRLEIIRVKNKKQWPIKDFK